MQRPSALLALSISIGLAQARSAPEPPHLELVGDWTIAVALSPASAPTHVSIAPPPVLVVSAERIDPLPVFDPKQPFWRRGARLPGVRTQETSAQNTLDSDSLQLRASAAQDAPLLTRDRDYRIDPEWGTIGRLADGAIGERQAVFASYKHGLARIDSIVLTPDGAIRVNPGTPHVTTPRQPDLAAGDRRLANVWIPARTPKLAPDLLYPILEIAYPEPPRQTPSIAERLIPKTHAKLVAGRPVKILAWGDSVTVGSFVPNPERDRWQCQFVTRLQARFPDAKIELLTEAWGGRNTGSYFAEPPGSPHNYAEKVLATRPDLVVSEFVNDAGLSPAGVDERYGRILKDLRQIGAEWIILTPHYTLPSMMKISSQREIDRDPRPYVDGLRAFASREGVALADASLRYGRLWRQGIPYMTLMSNAINHPDERGMKLFADSLMELF